MTAEDFARLLGGKKVGKGKWVALCPSHDDRSPSLSIAEGKRRPVLFRCMSVGCPPEAILTAMGLNWPDVMGDRIIDPKAIREAEMKRRQQEAARKREKYRVRMLIDQCRYWERRYHDLGADLVVHDSDKTARLFHAALDRFRALEAQVWPILHPKGV